MPCPITSPQLHATATQDARKKRSLDKGELTARDESQMQDEGSDRVTKCGDDGHLDSGQQEAADRGLAVGVTMNVHLEISWVRDDLDGSLRFAIEPLASAKSARGATTIGHWSAT